MLLTRSNKICVAIPSCNELYLVRTIQQISASAKHPEDLEFWVVLDAWEPAKNVEYHHELTKLTALQVRDSRLHIISYTVRKGVRHALNHILALTTCKYFIKCDAHIEMSQNWDERFIQVFEDKGPDCLLVPSICSMDPEDNFKWGERLFQYFSIDKNIHQQHWFEYASRYPEDQLVVPVMANMGATWFSTVQYWWQIGGHDEDLYWWGESSPETSLKTWLSGGSMYLVKDIIWAHVFRRRFPYRISAKKISENKMQTKEYWWQNKHPFQVHTINWLRNKFHPVPGWE